MSESSFPLIRKFFSEMKGDAKGSVRLLAVMILLGISLLLLGLGSCEGEGVEDSHLSEESLALDAWRELEEEKLVSLLCQIDGVERCYVSIRYLSGEESTKGMSATTSFEPPRVGAVVVLYDGAGGVRVKETLVEVVTTLYGIGAHRVSINLL